MQRPIYINHEHEVIISRFLHTVIESVEEMSTPTKSEDFKDVVNIIIGYHNNYNKQSTKGYYGDFMTIIPTNLTCCVNGFIAGLTNKRNMAKCRAYKLLINEMAHKVLEDLETLELINE